MLLFLLVLGFYVTNFVKMVKAMQRGWKAKAPLFYFGTFVVAFATNFVLGAMAGIIVVMAGGEMTDTIVTILNFVGSGVVILYQFLLMQKLDEMITCPKIAPDFPDVEPAIEVPDDCIKVVD
jgi:hypothetical protein